MELFPKYIRLNGKLEEVASLIQKADYKTDWEVEWFSFLKEWYNETDEIVVQTSGSTGNPKTIHLKKSFVADSAKRTLDFFRLKKDDRVLHCLPSRYIAGKLMTIRALIGKLNLILVDPSTNFSFLQNENFKFAALVPNQMTKLLDSQPATRNPQLILLGGSAIPQSLEVKLQSVDAQCYSSYGMTETATHIAVRKINGEKSDDFYHCLGNIHVEKSENDCLKIYMPGLSESPLQTTDLVKLIDNKTFQVIGRADNVLISGGIKYSPEEIEKKLDPFIEYPFYISSLPDDKLGQQIVMCVEAEETPELREYLAGVSSTNLSKYEAPRKIIFEKSFNRTPNGKIIRN